MLVPSPYILQFGFIIVMDESPAFWKAFFPIAVTLAGMTTVLSEEQL